MKREANVQKICCLFYGSEPNVFVARVVCGYFFGLGPVLHANIDAAQSQSLT